MALQFEKIRVLANVQSSGGYMFLLFEPTMPRWHGAVDDEALVFERPACSGVTINLASRCRVCWDR